MINNKEQRSWLERPIHPSLPALTNEIIIFAVVILAAIATRFYDLGTRVMSHDESLITYFSWLLYKGNGYQHTPMMHGRQRLSAYAHDARAAGILPDRNILFSFWPQRL
ncbi:MAG: hypothetical protein HYR93_11970 [Chloroflexi bacterium]|nr:hypothetical protein [Chloroflexota bacterium]